MFFKKFDKKLIFVIGTGRSGTHLLGRTIGNSDKVDSFIENEEFFIPVTQMAVGLNKEPMAFRNLLRKYKKVFKNSNKEYILEKSHPNIWFVEKIIEFFPQAKFIGIRRNVYATVCSMLEHKAVLNWYNIVPLDQVNPFLGITLGNLENFKDLPLESKCSLRWLSHAERLDYLECNFPDKVLVVNYEDFFSDNENLQNKIRSFLKVEFVFENEPLKIDSKDKWKISLSKTQIENINKVIPS